LRNVGTEWLLLGVRVTFFDLADPVGVEELLKI
jgi:hypothetical protein